MSLREKVDDQSTISLKQRLCLLHSVFSAEEIVKLEPQAIRFQFMLENGVKAASIMAAGILPLRLKDMGAQDAFDLLRVGFDSLFLTDVRFVAEAVAAYGADQVKGAFLQCASDAVCVAGSDAVEKLDIGIEELLNLCAGAPIEAAAVLQQLPTGRSLKGATANTLLNTGLRKKKLSELGYSLTAVLKQTNATTSEMQKLGFNS